MHINYKLTHWIWYLDSISQLYVMFIFSLMNLYIQDRYAACNEKIKIILFYNQYANIKPIGLNPWYHYGQSE